MLLPIISYSVLPLLKSIYSQVPLYRSAIYRDFTHSTPMTAAEHESDLKLKTSELWDV